MASRIGRIPSEHLRQSLLQNKTLHVVKMNVVKKCLEIRAEIGELNGDYMVFDAQFGKCLKLETHEVSTIRAKTAELLELNTSKSENLQFSFKEYVDSMKGELYDIYYFTGASIAVVSSLPVLGLRRKSFEVLFHYKAEPVDEFAVQQ